MRIEIVEILSTNSQFFQHVDLSLSDFTGKCLVELKEVQTIQSVILNGNLHEKYLKQFLQSHPKLIELCLSDNSTEISYLPQLCPNLSVLNLSWSWEYRNRQENDFLIRPFPLFTSLKELVVSLNYHFDHAALKSLCNSCPKLQVLNCMYTRVTPNQLSCLRRLKNLRTLRLAFINDDIGRVTDEVLTNIIDGSGGNIEELLVEGCTNLTDSSLIDLASQCPKLSKLYLSYSPKVTTNGWRKFLNIITSHPYCESQPRRQIVIEEAWMKVISVFCTVSGLTLFFL